MALFRSFRPLDVIYSQIHSITQCRCTSVSLSTINNTNTRTWFVFIPKETISIPLHQWSSVQRTHARTNAHTHTHTIFKAFRLKWTDQMWHGCYLASCRYFIFIMNITFAAKYNLITHCCCSDNGKDMNDCRSKCFVCNSVYLTGLNLYLL